MRILARLLLLPDTSAHDCRNITLAALLRRPPCPQIPWFIRIRRNAGAMLRGQTGRKGLTARKFTDMTRLGSALALILCAATLSACVDTDGYRDRPWRDHHWRDRDHRPEDRPWRPDEPWRPDRPGRPDRPDRPDRPGRPDWPGRPDRPDRPDRPGRPGRPDCVSGPAIDCAPRPDIQPGGPDCRGGPATTPSPDCIEPRRPRRVDP